MIEWLLCGVQGVCFAEMTRRGERRARKCLEIKGFVLLEDGVGVAELEGAFSGVEADLGEALGIAEDLDGVLGHGVGVIDRGEKAAVLVFDQLAEAADITGDNGESTTHGFEGCEAEAFGFGRHEHQVALLEILDDIFAFSEEADAILESALFDLFGCVAAFGAFADQEQAGGKGLIDGGEGVDHVGDAFDGAEVGDVSEDGCVVEGGDTGEKVVDTLFVAVGGGREALCIDKVGDHCDGKRGREIEERVSDFAQIARGCGDRVGGKEGHACDRAVTIEASDTCDIGAVKRDDQAGSAALEDLASEIAADGVRDGVVEM